MNSRSTSQITTRAHARRPRSLASLVLLAMVLVASAGAIGAAGTPLWRVLPEVILDNTRLEPHRTELTAYRTSVRDAVREARSAFVESNARQFRSIQEAAASLRRTEYPMIAQFLADLDRLLRAEAAAADALASAFSALDVGNVISARRFGAIVEQGYLILSDSMDAARCLALSRVVNDDARYPALNRQLEAETPAISLWEGYESLIVSPDPKQRRLAVNKLCELVEAYEASSKHADAVEKLQSHWEDVEVELRELISINPQSAGQRCLYYFSWFTIAPYVELLENIYKEATGGEADLARIKELHDNVDVARERYLELLAEKQQLLADDDPMYTFVRQLSNRLSPNPNAVVPEMPLIDVYAGLFDELYAAEAYGTLYPLIDTLYSTATKNSHEQIALNSLREEYHQRYYEAVRGKDADATGASWYFWRRDSLTLSSERPDREDSELDIFRVARGSGSAVYLDDAILNGEWQYEIEWGDADDSSTWPTQVTFFFKTDVPHDGVNVKIALANRAVSGSYRATITVYSADNRTTNETVELPNIGSRVDVRCEIDGTEVVIKAGGRTIYDVDDAANAHLAALTGEFGFEVSGVDAFIKFRKFKFSGERAGE